MTSRLYSLLKDAQFVFRLIRKSPAMTGLVIAALTLGIGLNTAVFSVLNAVLLRSIPVHEPERVFSIFAKINPSGNSLGISYPEYEDWKIESHSFQSLMVICILSFNLTGRGLPEHVKAYGVSGSLADIFDLPPALGREFTDQDDRRGAAPVAILSYELWQRKFGADRAVIGTPVILDDKPYTIVGVLQPSPIPFLRPDVWVPNGLFLNERIINRDSRYYWPQARLKSSISRETAESEMRAIAARLAAQYPASNKNAGVRFQGLVELVIGKVKRPLTFLFLASILIFALAGVNIVMVFLAMTGQRQSEFGIRLALGAQRSSLLRQFVVQSIMLIASGGTLALLLAWLVIKVFVRKFPEAVPRFHDVTINSPVIAFMLALAIMLAFATSIAPMLYLFRTGSNAIHNQDNSALFLRRHGFAQGTMIALEVSLAAALSLATGLMIKSSYEVTKVDLGFNPRHVLSFQLDLPDSRYGQGAQQAAFYKLALEKISNSPGLATTSAVTALPLTSQGGVINVQLESSAPLAEERPLVEDEAVLPGFFKALNIPLLHGRDFRQSDGAGSPAVVIVDDLLAQQFWPGQSPLGKRIRLASPSDSTAPWREVVGVVHRIRHFGPEREPRWPRAYVPFYQDPRPTLSFIMNTTLPQAAVRSAIESAVRQIDPELPLDNFRSLEDLLNNYTGPRTLSLGLLGCFAAVALALGAIGIYGLVSHSVVRRRRDIAVRLALGASRRQALLMAVRPALMGSLAGMLLGGIAVAAISRVLAAFLFGTAALDPSIYALTAVVTLLIAVFAAFLAARTVLKLEPHQVLRES